MGQLTGSQAAPHERPLPPSNTPSCKPFSVLQQKPPSYQIAELVPEHTAHSHYSTFAVCAVLSCFSHVRLFSTPWTVVHKAPLSTGILQARILDWVAISSSRGSSWPGDRTGSPVAPALPADSLPLSHRGSRCSAVYGSAKVQKLAWWAHAWGYNRVGVACDMEYQGMGEQKGLVTNTSAEATSRHHRSHASLDA